MSGILQIVYVNHSMPSLKTVHARRTSFCNSTGDTITLSLSSNSNGVVIEPNSTVLGVTGKIEAIRYLGSSYYSSHGNDYSIHTNVRVIIVESDASLIMHIGFP